VREDRGWLRTTWLVSICDSTGSRRHEVTTKHWHKVVGHNNELEASHQRVAESVSWVGRMLATESRLQSWQRMGLKSRLSMRMGRGLISWSVELELCDREGVSKWVESRMTCERTKQWEHWGIEPSMESERLEVPEVESGRMGRCLDEMLCLFVTCVVLFS